MATQKIKLEIVSIGGKVRTEEVDSVVLPTDSGETGILYNHIPIITTLTAGELRLNKGSNTDYFAVSGGFAEVSNNKVIVLADLAERIEDLDLDAIKKAKEDAEKTMKQKGITKLQFKEAEREVRRSITMLKVAERRTRKKQILSSDNPNLK